MKGSRKGTESRQAWPEPREQRGVHVWPAHRGGCSLCVHIFEHAGLCLASEAGGARRFREGLLEP